MGVLDYLQRLANQVGNAVSLALQIVTTLISSGWYIVIRDAATVTGDIHGLLEDPTCGQEAQCTLLNTILTDLATLSTDLAALGNPQQTGSPVTLPATAPATFLDETNDQTAATIWNYTDFRGLFTAFGALYDVYNLVTGLTQSFALPTIGPAHFVISGAIAGVANVNWPLLALPSTDTILSTDADVGAWLNRQTSPLVWSFITGQKVWRHTFTGPPLFEVDCTLSESEFRWFRLANSGLVPGTNVPPVWPGLANVTYGATQSMDAPNGSLTGPADGYKIVINAVPGWAGKFDFGAVQSWRNVGAIAFVDDEGVPEPAQTLGFANVIYTPQRMAHTVGAYYRIATGYHADATAFVINS